MLPLKFGRIAAKKEVVHHLNSRLVAYCDVLRHRRSSLLEIVALVGRALDLPERGHRIKRQAGVKFVIIPIAAGFFVVLFLEPK